jgi:acyl-coenzyme A thioesterase PaaI-like protein
MNGCFGCDTANASGLKMRFFRDGAGRLSASCTPCEHHRGLGRIVNGGLVSTFAEELAAAEAGAHGTGGLVVVRAEIKFEQAAYVGHEIRAVVASASKRGRAVDVSVDVSANGARVAVFNATFVLVSEERLREIAGIGLDQAPACLIAGRHPLPTEA